MPIYVALIHKDKSSDFGVSFPDFPGCIAVGATLQEALEGAKEALEFHMEGMVEDGEFIPEPTSLDVVAKSRAKIAGDDKFIQGNFDDMIGESAIRRAWEEARGKMEPEGLPLAE